MARRHDKLARAEADPPLVVGPSPEAGRPPPGLTSQQQVAVVHRGASVVLSSGAGCGKTHVLTERYLSHLRDDGAEVGQIVAITFTDRAARQMRARIRRALAQELRAAEADADVERWAKHLRGLESAQITTIHAYCAALLRLYAVEAGLDPAFDVLEDVLAVNLEAEALMDGLQELLTSRSATGDDLRTLVLLHGWTATVEAVEHLMQTWEGPAWQAWLDRTPEEIAEEWRTHARHELLPRYVAYLVSAAPKVAQCLALLRDTPCLGPEMRISVQRLLAETPRLAEVPDLPAAVAELIALARVGKERAKAWPSEEAYRAIQKAFEGFRTELPERLRLFTEPPERLPEAIGTGQRFLRVADAVMQLYRQRKRRAGVLDFQDLLVLARDLVREHAEVRSQLQRRYRFLLIDELQDTDPVQMELVELLCGAGLSGGKLFAVGDHSQSIYRFRGADVRLFQDLKTRVPHDGRLGLTVNFRSQPAILRFTNALLGQRLKDYEPLEPHHAQVNPDACIEFLWTARADRELVNEARASEADAIARRIAQMIGAPEHLVVEREASGGESLRAVRPGDIVLLFRAMSHVPVYEAALRRHGIDYYLVGGRAFFAQQEIYDLLNLLRALENPQDSLSLAGTLRSPFCCLSDEALFLLARHPKGLWAGLRDEAMSSRLPDDQRETVVRARRFLERWHGLKDRLPIARLLGEVFADSGYDAATQFEFLGDRKLANLWKLIDLARGFDRSGLFGLAEFIRRLADLVRTQPREEQAATQPENADVVRLMTIHQAKGLEFPIVFIPDLAAPVGAARMPVAHWDSRLGCVVRPPSDEEEPPFTDFGWQLWKAEEAVADWEEDLRTLYVACTRAQDYLVLSTALPEPFRATNTWVHTLAERFDLRTGSCLDHANYDERLPRVRVVTAESLPASVGLPAAPDDRTEVPEAQAAAAIQPIPVRCPAAAILPLASVELLLRRQGKKGTLSLADFFPQFHAEDGSDRTVWARPWDRYIPLMTHRERALRSLLERWDFRDPEGWRPLLAEVVPAEEPAVAKELEASLSHFAVSELRSQLAQARARHLHVPFQHAWDQGDLLFEEDLPAVEGLIDALWQDVDGDWHLVRWSVEENHATSLRKLGETCRAGLVLQACAVRRRLGIGPRTVRLWSFASSQELCWPLDTLAQARLLEEVRAVLRDFAGQSLSP